MGGNYPDGVSGNEFEISGPDREYDDERTCGNENAVLRTTSMTGWSNLRRAVALLETDERNDSPANLLEALGLARKALSEHEEIDLEGLVCPFVGDVTIQGYQGEEWWTCPVCRIEHTTETD